jgi:hypothetical protein
VVALSPGVKWQGYEADHSSPTSSGVKKMWIYTPTPPNLMTWCLVKQRDNFTFYLIPTVMITFIAQHNKKYMQKKRDATTLLHEFYMNIEQAAGIKTIYLG